MGIIMVRESATQDEAFDLLRIVSQGTHRQLSEIAAQSKGAMTDTTRVLAALARAIAANAALRPLPLRLCQACVDILGAAGGAITLAYTHPERVTLCATDDTAARLEDLQDVLGQGPGPDAFTGGRAITAVVDQSERRWPMFVEAVRTSVGDVIIQAVPIRPETRVLGVLTVHRRPSAFADPAEEQAQFLADAVGAALLGDPASQSELSGGPWASRARVHQATGMVLAQLNIDAEDALVLLRAHAFAHSISLEDVAAEVTAFRLDFSTADATGDEQ
jgi:GAF domain/ANTAR domain